MTGVEEVITEATVGFEQVGLNATRWLDGHLGAVLQDGHWKLVAGKAREPQAEVPVYLEAMPPLSWRRPTQAPQTQTWTPSDMDSRPSSTLSHSRLQRPSVKNKGFSKGLRGPLCIGLG